MQITMVSQVSGNTHTREIPIKPERYFQWVASNTHIQKYFPDLSPEDRRFMSMGITPEEWDKMFPQKEL